MLANTAFPNFRTALGLGLDGQHRRLRPQGEDFGHDRFQAGQGKITARIAQPRRLQQQRRAARRPSHFGVRPFIADDKRLVQVHLPFERGLQQQPGLRLAAGALVSRLMRAYQDIIQRKNAPQQVVHPIQLAPRLIPARQARLVGRGNQQETRGL